MRCDGVPGVGHVRKSSKAKRLSFSVQEKRDGM